jgi:hypothetical protein
MRAAFLAPAVLAVSLSLQTGCFYTYEVWKKAVAKDMKLSSVLGVSRTDPDSVFQGDGEHLILDYRVRGYENPFGLIPDDYHVALRFDRSNLSGPFFYTGSLYLPPDVISSLSKDERFRIANHPFSKNQFRLGHRIVKTDSYWRNGLAEARFLTVDDYEVRSGIRVLPFWDSRDYPYWKPYAEQGPDPSARMGILLLPASQYRPTKDQVVGIAIAAVETPFLVVADIVLFPIVLVAFSHADG